MGGASASYRIPLHSLSQLVYQRRTSLDLVFIANLSTLFIPTADSMASPSDTKNLGDVSGLVAVVTGGIYIFFDEQSRYRIRQRRADTSAGGTGIGLIIAKALEANGAKKVFITGRRQDRLDAAAKQAVRAHQM